MKVRKVKPKVEEPLVEEVSEGESVSISPFWRLVCLIYLPGAWYVIKVLDPAKAVIGSEIEVRGRKYIVDPSMAYKLKGWSPLRKQSWWWNTYFDLIDYYIFRPGILVYRTPKEDDGSAIAPMDRQSLMTEYETLTPWTNQAFSESKLKAKYDASTKYGNTVDTRVVLIVAGVLIATLAIMYMGGFLSVG